MGVLLLLCCIIIFRIFFLKEKAVMLMMIGLLTIGAASAIVVANLVLQLFTIAHIWKDLWEAVTTDPERLNHIYHGNAWSLCVFLASFNAAHWIFAM
jgi:hypothetical protein